MADPVWLGIDLGTQSVRVLAVDGTGEIAGRGSAPLAGRRDGVCHEQDPGQWWAAVQTASRQALSSVDASRVAGLAVDATSGTVLLGDVTARPLTPALMYDDGRATTEAAAVNTAGGPLWTELGYRSMPASWALPKLRWLLRHHGPWPGDQVRLYHQADFITSRLAGRPVPTDSSHALKTGYHLLAERWPGDLLATLGIPGSLLPEVVRPGTVVGEVAAAAAAATGIPAGTRIVAGMTDGCAAQLGAGALEPGAWNAVLGTTLVLKGVAGHLIRDPGGVVYCHRGPGGTWLPGGASSAGAGAITQRFPDDDLDALTARAAALPPGPVAYPLAGRGERFPFHAPQAEPFLLGTADDDAAMFGALLLGVACVERLCFDYLDFLGAPAGGPLSFTGGATRNRHWCQLRADLLGRPVWLPEQAEAALGMAVLAATASGISLTHAAAAMVHRGGGLEPRPGQAHRLLDRYHAFLDQLTALGWLGPVVAGHAHGRAEP